MLYLSSEKWRINLIFLSVKTLVIMFLNVQNFKRCLFIDIETVSEYPDYLSMPEDKKRFWDIKAEQIKKYAPEEESKLSAEALYLNKAGIFAEFSKVVCISMGFLHFERDEPVRVRIKSLAGEDEKTILHDFSSLLTNHYNNPENSSICGHNIKEFDIPFLCRRMVIQGVPFPPILDISGKKPWQTNHLLDTLEMWRFGDYKNYTSLGLLSTTLGIPSPKDDIDGSMVGSVFWDDQDIDRIVTYCQKDVITTVNVIMKFAGKAIFDVDQVEIINTKV